MSEVSTQAPLARELSLDAIEPERRVRGHLGDDLAAQCGRAIVDAVERGIGGPFFVARDPQIVGRAAYLGVAPVPAAFVPVDGHHSVRAGAALERRQGPAIVERE